MAGFKPWTATAAGPMSTLCPRVSPRRHIAFLRGLGLSFSGREPDHDLGHDILCVHAGIDPQRPLADQGVEHLLWIRHEFIDKPHSLPYTIVYGHTPQPELRFHLPYKVGIDTGLVYGGRLSVPRMDHQDRVPGGKGQPAGTSR